jgi:hypothetical protein
MILLCYHCSQSMDWVCCNQLPNPLCPSILCLCKCHQSRHVCVATKNQQVDAVVQVVIGDSRGWVGIMPTNGHGAPTQDTKPTAQPRGYQVLHQEHSDWVTQVCFPLPRTHMCPSLCRLLCRRTCVRACVCKCECGCVCVCVCVCERMYCSGVSASLISLSSRN